MIKINGKSMEEIKTGQQAIYYFGRKLYGENFSLEGPRLEIYRKVYNEFLNPDGKGFLIQGTKGVGKSSMMKIMQKLFLNTPRKFKSIDAFQLKDMMDSGEYKAVDIKLLYGYASKCDLYIDDIGFGQADINSYGNVTNIVAELLFERDRLWTEDNFRTHLSSNISTAISKEEIEKNPFKANLPTLEKIYGDRILDRIKGMTNLITWKGESLRLNQ